MTIYESSRRKTLFLVLKLIRTRWSPWISQKYYSGGVKSCCAKVFLCTVSDMSSWLVKCHKSSSVLTIQNYSSSLLGFSVCVIRPPKGVKKLNEIRKSFDILLNCSQFISIKDPDFSMLYVHIAYMYGRYNCSYVKYEDSNILSFNRHV